MGELYRDCMFDLPGMNMLLHMKNSNIIANSIIQFLNILNTFYYKILVLVLQGLSFRHSFCSQEHRYRIVCIKKMPFVF